MDCGWSLTTNTKEDDDGYGDFEDVETREKYKLSQRNDGGNGAYHRKDELTNRNRG